MIVAKWGQKSQLVKNRVAQMFGTWRRASSYDRITFNKMKKSPLSFLSVRYFFLMRPLGQRRWRLLGNKRDPFSDVDSYIFVLNCSIDERLTYHRKQQVANWGSSNISTTKPPINQWDFIIVNTNNRREVIYSGRMIYL